MSSPPPRKRARPLSTSEPPSSSTFRATTETVGHALDNISEEINSSHSPPGLTSKDAIVKFDLNLFFQEYGQKVVPSLDLSYPQSYPPVVSDATSPLVSQQQHLLATSSLTQTAAQAFVERPHRQLPVPLGGPQPQPPLTDYSRLVLQSSAEQPSGKLIPQLPQSQQPPPASNLHLLAQRPNWQATHLGIGQQYGHYGELQQSLGHPPFDHNPYFSQTRGQMLLNTPVAPPQLGTPSVALQHPELQSFYSLSSNLPGPRREGGSPAPALRAEPSAQKRKARTLPSVPGYPSGPVYAGGPSSSSHSGYRPNYCDLGSVNFSQQRNLLASQYTGPSIATGAGPSTHAGSRYPSQNHVPPNLAFNQQVAGSYALQASHNAGQPVPGWEGSNGAGHQATSLGQVARPPAPPLGISLAEVQPPTPQIFQHFSNEGHPDWYGRPEPSRKRGFQASFGPGGENSEQIAGPSITQNHVSQAGPSNPLTHSLPSLAVTQSATMSSQPPQRPPRQRRDRKDTRSAAMSQRDRDRMRTTPKEMKPTIRRMLRSVIRSQQDYTSVPEELGCANCLSGGVPCYVYAIHAVAVFSSKLHGKRTPVYGLCQTCKFRGLNCPFSKNIPPHQPRARQPQPPRTGKTQTKEEKKQRQKELLASQHPSKQAWEKKTDKWLSKSMSPQEGATRPNVSESAAVVEAGLVRSDADTGSASERNAEAAVLESVARGSADLASPPDAVNNNHSPQEDDDDDLEEVVW